MEPRTVATYSVIHHRADIVHNSSSTSSSGIGFACHRPALEEKILSRQHFHRHSDGIVNITAMFDTIHGVAVSFVIALTSSSSLRVSFCVLRHIIAPSAPSSSLFSHTQHPLTLHPAISSITPPLPPRLLPHHLPHHHEGFHAEQPGVNRAGQPKAEGSLPLFS